LPPPHQRQNGDNTDRQREGQDFF